MHRLMVPSTADRHDWSYDRSPRLIVQSDVGRNNWSLVAPTSRKISYDGSCHRFSPIVRDSATTCRDRSLYSTTAVDRSRHCRSVASWPNRNKSYDQEIVRSGVTVALDKLICDVDPSLANYDRFMMIVQATARKHIPQENRNKYYPRLTWANATIIIQLSEYEYTFAKTALILPYLRFKCITQVCMVEAEVPPNIRRPN